MDNIILKHKQLYSASNSDEKVLKVGSRNVVGLCVHVFENTTFVMKIQLLGVRNTVFRSQRLAGLHVYLKELCFLKCTISGKSVSIHF